MTKADRDSFNRLFCQNVRANRLRLGYTQEVMAGELGVPLDRYKKWENRTPMPHALIPRFAGICEISIGTLYVVHGEQPKGFDRDRPSRIQKT